MSEPPFNTVVHECCEDVIRLRAVLRQAAAALLSVRDIYAEEINPTTLTMVVESLAAIHEVLLAALAEEG